MRSWHFHIEGQVQGVGFRPFVFRAATTQGLAGEVSNGADGVHVRFQASEDSAHVFTAHLLAEAPLLARITGFTLREIPDFKPKGFRIVKSESSGKPHLLVAPDFALCHVCRAELANPSNRRYGYAFTTCTSCGPRYSILRGLPYDRAFTEMVGFSMCPDCEAEYTNPHDRRHHSQTNSCPGCGVKLRWYQCRGREEGFSESGSQEDLLIHGVRVLSQGGILAVKGIGGYLLMCDASNPEVIQRLRDGKIRPDKPFALLYPNLESVERDAEVAASEAKALQGPECPIVILKTRPEAGLGLNLGGIAPGLTRIGVMLPCAPIIEILCQIFGRPLVATSGNLSGMPIVHEDEVALSVFPVVADGILGHNRPITVPQDDSVMMFSPKYHIPILLRRARGFAPNVFPTHLNWSGTTRLALGAEMKGAVGILSQRQAFLSQYLGSLGQYESQLNCRKIVNHLLQLVKAEPESLSCDLHPDYFTTSLADELVQKWGIPVHRFQHHKAHFAALLAEHTLHDSDSRVLGVVWDGTGYGDDGKMWGSEFFIREGHEMIRCGHLEAFPNLAGDKMAREPRLSALSAGWDSEIVRETIHSQYSDVEWGVYHRLIVNKASPETTSMGRLFDAVSVLLGGPGKISYEGQAGMWVEECARNFVGNNGWAQALALQPFSVRSRLSACELLEELVYAMRAGESTEMLSMRFHLTLSEWIKRIGDRESADTIGFSGGVFQNGILIDIIAAQHGSDRKLLFHRFLPPSDENIAFGQLVLEEFGPGVLP